jgi:MarR family transcriptional regulator for hemolysin
MPTSDHHISELPSSLPIGLALSRAARLVTRAFDAALTEAGGSLPAWLILLNVKLRGSVKQRELAEAVGISEATLTHHLSTLEADGLLARTRQEGNRRVQLVALTEAGEARFLALREAALAFDTRLRQGIEPDQVSMLGELLDHVSANVAPDNRKSPPWAGLIERKERDHGR